ncbi:MAG: hypothetical protein Kow0090_11750 [Myxococcota bacterium]
MLVGVFITMKRSFAIDEKARARFFKALSDPNRLTIFNRLAECDAPCNVSELAGCCLISFSVVARHLVALREAGILTAQKRGKEVFYSVNRKLVADFFRRIADSIEDGGDFCRSVASKKGGTEKIKGVNR